VRHARGFVESLRPPRRTRTLSWLVASAVLAYGMSAAVLGGALSVTRRMGQPPGPAEIAYVIVLTTSLWMAWGTRVRTGFSPLNARLIAAGMTSFYLCDLCVGMSTALGSLMTRPGSFFENCVGFFYSPALVLLAMSGYAWPPTRTASRA
jgi:hypothetical protein